MYGWNKFILLVLETKCAARNTSPAPVTFEAIICFGRYEANPLIDLLLASYLPLVTIASFAPSLYRDSAASDEHEKLLPRISEASSKFA